jgi:succinyl-diaminopimelate desuccinylase
MLDRLNHDESRAVAAVEAQAESLLALLQALVQAPSLNPPGDTRAATTVAADWLGARYIACRLVGAAPERPSLLAEAQPFDSPPPNHPRLLYLSHLDTVPLGNPDAWSVDPFGGAIHDGRLWGRGAADAKGSAAAMLLALSVLASLQLPLRGSVTVALAADEETGGAGARYLIEQGQVEADAVIVGETTDNQVAIAEKGVAWLRLTTGGRTAHASTPHAGVNAAAHLVRWLDGVDRIVASRLHERQHPLVTPPTLNLSTIGGGVAPNVVPDHAEAIVDRRTLPGESLEDVRHELWSIAASLTDADPSFDPGLETVVWADPFETPPDAPLVAAALAARRALGLPAAPVGYQQASDGRFFGARGIPTIVLGPGVAEGTHVPDESVPLAQLVQAAQLHVLTALRLLGPASG